MHLKFKDIINNQTYLFYIFIIHQTFAQNFYIYIDSYSTRPATITKLMVIKTLYYVKNNLADVRNLLNMNS